MRLVALAYLAFLLILPVGLVFWRTFEHGVGPVWDALSTPAATHAFTLTIEVAVLAVLCNTIFGVAASLLLVEERFQNFDQPAAYAMAFVLAAIAVVVLITINLFRPERDR